MGNDLISVIIPVYNVEQYLKICLDSVCSQSYRNIQIILVDDGSTDSSGSICEEYADADSRIMVIHKKNGGLSDARNEGIKAATGEYIGFVDSDDWIEPDMYEKLYDFAVDYDLDVVAARFIGERECETAEPKGTGKFEIYSGIEMLEINLIGKGDRLVSNAVWDRLYKRELLEGIWFPKGKCYEDICFSTEIFLKAAKCGYWDKEIYHYRIRKDSIMGTGGRNELYFNENIITDFLPFMKEKADILYAAGYRELGDESHFQYLYQMLQCLVKVYGRNEYKTYYDDMLCQYHSNKNWIREYVKKVEDKRRRVILRISNLSVGLYVFISKGKKLAMTIRVKTR